MKEERVEVFIPRGSAEEEPNLFVAVNGVNYLLPRGQSSLVVPAVAKELALCRKAQQRMDRRIDEMSAKA